MRRRKEDSPARLAAWALLSSGAALAAGALADRLVRLGWRALGAGDPVLRPGGKSKARWGAAIAATAATAAAVAVTELLAEEALHRAWARATGTRPPSL